jgi:hypothetical protein
MVRSDLAALNSRAGLPPVRYLPASTTPAQRVRTSADVVEEVGCGAGSVLIQFP